MPENISYEDTVQTLMWSFTLKILSSSFYSAQSSHLICAHKENFLFLVNRRETWTKLYFSCLFFYKQWKAITWARLVLERLRHQWNRSCSAQVILPKLVWAQKLPKPWSFLCCPEKVFINKALGPQIVHWFVFSCLYYFFSFFYFMQVTYYTSAALADVILRGEKNSFLS